MNRPYDMIVYGATGSLGSLVVQYLWANSPPTLRWAVAGRSEQKLVALVNTLDRAQSHRKLPHIMVATLTDDDLGRMASQTRLVLNTVGPFCKYGTPVVVACIENSTAYVDSTGEHVWTQHLAAQWHDKAMANKAIIIPQCAVESSPPDLMTLLLARRLRRPLGPVFFTIQHTWTGYSGGTIASILASLETYSIRQMMAASAPRATCIPDAGPHRPHPPPVLPVRRDRFLGNLTFNPSATADRAVVMRTWSLLQRHGDLTEQYGERFSFQGYTTASSWLQAWSSFLAMSVAVVCVLLFPPLRWLLQWLSPQPGTGPQVTGEKHFVEWKATVAVDGGDVSQRSALGVMRMNTDVYSVCASLVSEAALTLLEILDRNDNGSMVKRLGGGILTPASLGMLYVKRLEKAGLEWKVTEIGKDE
ncbi:putative trans-acting enoyl reductase MT2525 [Aspergillus udagawae]|nr:putative trans-acting enoyl reductase MT2525 [Aspergillus udagawae]